MRPKSALPHSAKPTEDPQEVARLIRDERIRMHVASSRSVVAATMAISTLVSAALFDAVRPTWGLLCWWLCFQVLMVVRLGYSERWRTDADRVLRGRLWERRLAVTASLSGLMWGLTGTLLYPTEESGLRPISALVQMGVSAAAVSSLSSLPGAFRGFFLLLMVPNILWLGLRDDYAAQLTALALFFFTGLIMINGSQVYRRIDRSIRLQLDLARAVRETEAALATARSANEAKSLFVANISHELRTPMHAILGFAQLGRERSAEHKIKDYFERIGYSGRRLLALIDDLLDLSKLEAGQMQLTLQRLGIRSVVDHAAREFEPLLRERRLHLVVDEEAQLPPALLDPQRFGQVVRNLLSNAVKFSPEGGSIYVRIKRSQGLAPMLQLIISDEGVGIPETELETIFDKFVQSSKTRTGAGGTGLGLAICRELVMAHHGLIHAHNAPTGGAVLVVELPPAPPQSAHPAVAA